MSLTPRLDRLEKNYIINGAFDYFQRATAATNLTANTFAYLTADRFQFTYTGTMTGTPTSGRSTDVPSNGLSLYSHQFISRRNASTSFLRTQHRIEAANAREIAGSVVSLSVWVKPETATTLRLRMATPTVIDTFGTLNADAVNTTAAITNSGWQQVKFENLSIPANANNGLMMQIDFESASGTDGANTNHYITQICLNKGSSAVNDFCRAGRDIGDELRLCQRYYQKSYLLEDAVPTASAYGIYLSTACDSAAEFKCQVLLPQYMRATPTLTSYKVDGTSGQIEYQRNGGATTAISPLVQGLGTNKFSWRGTGFTAGDRVVLIGHYSLSSEL